MARLGLNCTLSYVNGGANHTYRVRANTLQHGIKMIYEESEARNFRAFYPHRLAMQRFAIMVQCKGIAERRSLVNWLASYAQYAIDPDIVQQDFPWMTVSLPARNFSEHGVPLTGYQWGNHVGSMVWNVTIEFEAATTPGQKGRPDVSSVINKWSAFATDPAVQYFYPSGTQLAGSQVPSGNYPQPVYPGDPTSFNNNWPGTGGNPAPPPPGGGPVAPGPPVSA